MTGIRVGVDVGGTFTKAVAVDPTTREILATSVVPTTHQSADGVAEGVVHAVAQVSNAVGAANIDLVTHSTTQAVNALLEGDVGVVGVIGMGRRPDLKKVEARTRLNNVEVAPGKYLKVRQAFFDVTDGLPEDAIRAALIDFKSHGVVSIAVAEAFSPDDATNEHQVSLLAREAGLSVCASTELSGLYGLELRTVTAALNASIVPIAVATADVVARGVLAAGISAPVMVMRSDGGATDLAGFIAAPVRTLYSGPSASVSGALRYTGVTDAIVIEVGGTSTNVAAIRQGRPALSYVRVASHATALRSVDVRVVGVAGGSMLRVRRNRVYGVGPRSAHIAGLRYACFVPLEQLDGATTHIGPATADDPSDYLMLRLTTGELVGITNTCAANAVGLPTDDDYCKAPQQAAAAAFEIAATAIKAPPLTIARQMLAASGEAICELALTVAKSSELESPTVVGVGGGAGGLARHVAAMLGWPVEIPPHAEIISSIGDALSLLRAERERTVDSLTDSVLDQMMEEVESEIVNAGASPGSVEIRVEEVPERSTIRAVATGAIGLLSGALPGREPATQELISAAHPGAAIEQSGAFWVATRGDRCAVLDRYGDEVVQVDGEIVRSGPAGLAASIGTHTRYRGPVTLRPSVWIIDGRRLVELAATDSATTPYAERTDVTVLVGRSI